MSTLWCTLPGILCGYCGTQSRDKMTLIYEITIAHENNYVKSILEVVIFTNLKLLVHDTYHSS